MYRVLIVDDDKLARKGLISIVPWEQCGFIVVGDVANGALALEFIEHNDVDLAVVDLAMPVLCGLDFIKECKLRKPEIKYVVLSSHESFDYIQKALRLGVFDYISKLQLDQEDCAEIFRRIAVQMDASSSMEVASRADKKEIMEGFCGEIDSLYCFYNREMLEDLQKRALAARLNEIERYRLMLHMLRTGSQRFDVRLSEENYNYADSKLQWMPALRDALVASAGCGCNNAHIERLIMAAAVYIAEHLTSHELKTESVADSINMSRSYFSTSFKKYTGFSVNGFIRKERVELAKQLIAKDSSMSFSEVSYQVGYRDEKYFAKVFQLREGVTFSEYKKALLTPFQGGGPEETARI